MTEDTIFKATNKGVKVYTEINIPMLFNLKINWFKIGTILYDKKEKDYYFKFNNKIIEIRTIGHNTIKEIHLEIRRLKIKHKIQS